MLSSSPIAGNCLQTLNPHVDASVCQVQWSGAEGLSPAFPPEAVEAVLLWADPWLSARVFGVGLYALICLRQLASGAPPGDAPDTSAVCVALPAARRRPCSFINAAAARRCCCPLLLRIVSCAARDCA